MSSRKTDASIHMFTGVLPKPILAAFLLFLTLTPVRAEERTVVPSLYSDGQPFLAAIEAERPKRKQDIPITGVTVPHHLLAADLIARGFWAASGKAYRRILVLSPD